MEGLRIACLLAGVVVFGFLAGTGLGISCYQCNSAYDPRCGDPFDPYSLGAGDCNARPKLTHIHNVEATMCRKITQKVYGKVRVVRGCGYVNESALREGRDCYQRTGTHDVSVQFCSCHGELCNAAAGLAPALGAALLALLARAFS
ncbi:uncharacterized protein LOC134528307 [Bacillus rossius redtenbacheri]|uniref:uncharacterized protein LOC134528307 n=1 Tax=Bacillus rossius redtenbacheri TaxID=93214 RepID=UPI002FDDCD95